MCLDYSRQQRHDEVRGNKIFHEEYYFQQYIRRARSCSLFSFFIITQTKSIISQHQSQQAHYSLSPLYLADKFYTFNQQSKHPQIQHSPCLIPARTPTASMTTPSTHRLVRNAAPGSAVLRASEVRPHFRNVLG